jgi:hypothetical protein
MAKARKSLAERNQSLESRLRTELLGKTITHVTVDLKDDGYRREIRLNFNDGMCLLIEWDSDMGVRLAAPGKVVSEERIRAADLAFIVSPTIGKLLSEAG